MTTPDPQTVREIARKFLLDPHMLASELKALIRDAMGPDAFDETFGAWYDAVRADARAGEVETVVSWPDEQPQDERDALAEVSTELDAANDDADAIADQRAAYREEIMRLRARVRELEGAQDARDADAQDYRYLADEIGATMTDEWDGDETESWILVQYVRWLAAGQPRDEDGYPIRRETYPAPEQKAAQDERDGDVRAPALLATVSGVCTCPKCEAVGRSIYRMVGKCSNCQSGPILMLFRAGDAARALECPFCGCREVYASRRATDDEIPAAAEDAELDAREAKAEAER